LSKGEASFGGSSKTRGVLEKWGVRIDGEWLEHGKKKKRRPKCYMWTGQPSVSGGTRLHGGEVRKKKDYF
jgi:hypothetical protein